MYIGDRMYIKFKMKGPDTDGWEYFECVMHSIEECIQFYKLNDPQVEYIICTTKQLRQTRLDY